MKKVTEAEYWDATYGETHDPMTGLPIGIDDNAWIRGLVWQTT